MNEHETAPGADMPEGLLQLDLQPMDNFPADAVLIVDSDEHGIAADEEQSE